MLTTAANSVYIGYQAYGKDNSDSNSIVIGATAVGNGANTVVLGNTNITTTTLRGNIIGATSIICSPTISTGTSAPTTTPTKVGDVFIDTTGKKIYFATGTTNSSDWTITN